MREGLKAFQGDALQMQASSPLSLNYKTTEIGGQLTRLRPMRTRIERLPS
ncbi:MAG: hypothetical protein RL068_337 [Actinomycetota bacterium]|jgi:hypothetical protein